MRMLCVCYSIVYVYVSGVHVSVQDVEDARMDQMLLLLLLMVCVQDVEDARKDQMMVISHLPPGQGQG